MLFLYNPVFLTPYPNSVNEEEDEPHSMKNFAKLGYKLIKEIGNEEENHIKSLIIQEKILQSFKEDEPPLLN